MSETGAKDPSRSNCFTVRNVLEVNSTMRAAERDAMHYCFVWKKWQWSVSLWMEANLCLNTGGGREVQGGPSGGRWRRRAVYWELDQWQVNPLWRKPFIFVKAFLLEIHWGPGGQLQMEMWQEINWFIESCKTSLTFEPSWGFITILKSWCLPEWRKPAARSSSPAAGSPCCGRCCSRPRWGRGTALWSGVGGWSTGRAADTVSAGRWAGGQTARSPETHSQWDQSGGLMLSGHYGCKSQPQAPPKCKSASKTTHKQPSGGGTQTPTTQ